MLEPKDDLRHHLRPGPHSRESLFYDLVLPDEGLLVFTYTWVNADERAGHLFAVVGDDNQKLAFSATDGVPTGGRDFDDWRVEGDTGEVWVKHTDLLRTASYGASAEGASLTVEFTGTHEAFDYARNDDGCPDFIADNRFEQGARVRGTLNLHGREIHFDTTGHRDHSWGTRDWNYLQHWKWMNAATPDGAASLHCMLMSVKGEVLVNGYINTAGVLSPIVDGKATADLDDQMIHRSISGVFHDELGREMRLEARYAAGWSMPIQHLLLNEIGMAATLDDAPATAHVELGWPAEYVKGLTR